MNDGGMRTLLLAAVVTAAIAWFGAAELALPARLAVVIMVGVLPPLLLLQAGIPPGQVDELRRVPVYLSSILFIWAIGIGAWWAGLASGFSATSMGFVRLDPVEGLLWTGVVVLVAVGGLALGRVLRWRETPLLEMLLPRGGTERLVFVLLSLSAGVFEEIAFRGFLIPALHMATDSLALGVVVSSVAFGMLHSYQSATGALRASVLGAVLAVPFLATGSLLPSMAAHALYDVLAGLLLADWALRRH